MSAPSGKKSLAAAGGKKDMIHGWRLGAKKDADLRQAVSNGYYKVPCLMGIIMEKIIKEEEDEILVDHHLPLLVGRKRLLRIML